MNESESSAEMHETQEDATPENGDPAAEHLRDAEETRTLSDEALLELKKKADERDLYREELLRAKAELDNFQRRMRRERPNWEDLAVRRVLSELLPVLDNFELAMSSATANSADTESLRQGVELIYQLLQKTLTDSGVEEIKAVDQTFDPEFHEAVWEEEVTDKETGEIIEVQQKGYLHNGVVIRPSRVKVAKNVKAQEDSSGDDKGTK